MQFATDLRFKIDVFTSEPVFELRHLSERKSVFDGQRNLIRNLSDKAKIVVAEGVFALLARPITPNTRSWLISGNRQND